MKYSRQNYTAVYIEKLMTIAVQYEKRYFIFQMHNGYFLEIDRIIFDIIMIWDRTNNDEVIHRLTDRYTEESIIDQLDQLEDYFIYHQPIEPVKEEALRTQKENNLYLMVTNHCNLACTYCYHEEDDKLDHRLRMDRRTMYDAINYFFELDLADEVVVHFFGGEPLLNFDLVQEMVPYLREKEVQKGIKVHFALSTNGSLVTDEIARYLKDQNFFVALSLDGGEKEHNIHRKYHDQTGSYTDVAAGVANLKRYFPYLAARVTVTKQTIDKLPQIFDDLFAIGINSISHKFVGACTSDLRIEQSHMESYKKNYRTIMDRIFTDITSGILHSSDRSMSWIHRVLNKPLLNECPIALNNKVVIDTTGDIYRCQETVGVECFIKANIYDTDNTAYTGLKAPLTHQHPVCADCMINQYCDGYCFYGSYSRYGTFDKQVPQFCEESHFTFMESLNLLIRLYCFDPEIALAYGSTSLTELDRYLQKVRTTAVAE